ncbi:type VI secretion system ATPase TssH [Salmonella enterica]|nr:type VI secretion system ATPase TssH [Salmonella enterica]EGW2853016.1 type VI secretion system ATPase TssH [Salmonella enterica]
MNQYLKKIVTTFDNDARQCLDAAISLALSRTHYEVCSVHLLLAVIKKFPVLMEQLENKAQLFPSTLLKVLQQELEHLDSGNKSEPVLSPALVEHLGKARLHASICWQSEHLPAVAFLASAMTEVAIENTALTMEMIQAMQCDKPIADRLMAETVMRSRINFQGEDSDLKCETALQKFTQNITEQAKNGKLDPVIGREKEIRQMIDVLLRRRQNNPILTGAPGVGKTALVEGLALRIAENKVPSSLRNMEILTLDLSRLIAGSSVKGEFEKRLESILREIKAYPSSVILFIDEAHMLIGAGGQAGQSDAANLLKPALARGELRMIGATTWAEYKKYFEKDAALARRFQLIKVEEPDEETAIAMLRSVAPMMSQHHSVTIPDSAIISAVTLSQRYLSDRQLPDKAVSLLDTTCARVALSQSHEPREIEELNVILRNIELERNSINGDEESKARLEWLNDYEKQTRDKLTALMPVWMKQNEKVASIRQSHSHEKKSALRKELSRMHQKHAMVYDCVDTICVAEVLSGWTGIPVKQILAKDYHCLDTLVQKLEERVIGQSHALKIIAQQILTIRSGLSDPDKPGGVFMLAGPSGVGKTETAQTLADFLYGGRRSLITINMSEYQEPHSVAGLKGAPPGYIGYGAGGVLTESVRRQPYSVVLLDEFEKAHPDVIELFYQIFDKGFLEDSEGLKVDFRNTLIIMTTNLACDIIEANGDTDFIDINVLNNKIRPEFDQVFRPALMGRLTLLPYLPLRSTSLHKIIRLKLNTIVARFVNQASEDRSLKYSNKVVEYITDKCHIRQSGAREIDTIINCELMPLLTNYIMNATTQDKLNLIIKKHQGKLKILAATGRSDETDL